MLNYFCNQRVQIDLNKFEVGKGKTELTVSRTNISQP